MPTLAILHTSTATVEPLRALAVELLPNCRVLNWVDDSILPQLAAGAGVAEVEPRVLAYARFAEQAGADVILEACSSIGELVSELQRNSNVPVVRIDEAMAEAAVAAGSVIAVAATLATTLDPTARLITSVAERAGKRVEVRRALVDGAYARLMAGDREGHDNDVAATVAELAATADVVVLAQASMARVLPRLPAALQAKCLSSPRLGMERVRREMMSDE